MGVAACVSHVTQSHVTQTHVTQTHVTQTHVTQSHVTQSHVTQSHVTHPRPRTSPTLHISALTCTCSCCSAVSVVFTALHSLTTQLCCPPEPVTTCSPLQSKVIVWQKAPMPCTREGERSWRGGRRCMGTGDMDKRTRVHTHTRTRAQADTHLQRVPKHQPRVLYCSGHKLLCLAAAFERAPTNLIRGLGFCC